MKSKSEQAKRALAIEADEKRRAAVWQSTQEAAIESRSQEMRQIDEAGLARTRTTVQEHDRAALRLRGSHEVFAKDLRETAERTHAHELERTNAVLALKASVAGVRGGLQRAVERKAVRRKELQQELDASRETLLNRGENPYAVFRQRALDEQAEAEERERRDNALASRADLMSEMATEKERLQRLDKASSLAKTYAGLHRESLGAHVVAKHNADFIKSTTAEHLDMLDPSGCLPQVFASQMTELADNSFGLGHSSRIDPERMRRVTERFRVNLKLDEQDFGEYTRRVKSSAPFATGVRNSRSASAEDRAEAPALDADHIPGATVAAVNINLKGDAGVMAALASSGKQLGSLDVDDSRSGRFKSVILSKFERDCLERRKSAARSRHTEGVPQTTVGRVFKGPGFIAKPAELSVIDFVVGSRYVRRFTLTNASYTFNSFQLLEFDRSVADFFSITFERMGKMSAGISCTIELTFTPLVDEDIDAHIHFYSETGPGSVPIKCRKMRCAPKVVNTRLDFGVVTLGQRVSQTVELKNTECVETRFSIVAMTAAVESVEENSSATTAIELVNGNAEPFDLQEVVAVEDDASALRQRVATVVTSVFERKRNEQPDAIAMVDSLGPLVLPGYSSRSVQFEFLPLYKGPFEQQFKVVFDSVADDGFIDRDEHTICREATVCVVGTGVESSIYLDHTEIDFRTIYFDKIYRKSFEVKNRGSVSMRVDVRVDRAMKEFVEVSPSMMFVQAGVSHTVHLKLLLTKRFLETLPAFLCPIRGFESSFQILLPIRIDIANEELPLFVNIKSDVSSSKLSFPLRRNLDFGDVYVNQTVSRSLVISNTSLLPQKICFQKVPVVVRVSPNDGFAILLPQESVCFDVSFTPSTTISSDLELLILSNVNDKYIVRVTGRGVASWLSLSSSSVDLPTVSPGQYCTERVTVSNTSLHTSVFEIVPPPETCSWLSVSPSVFKLNPGQTFSIELSFRPPAHTISTDPIVYLTATTSDLGEQQQALFDSVSDGMNLIEAVNMFGSVRWSKLTATPALHDSADPETPERSAPPADWCIHGNWRLPIFVKSIVDVAPIILAVSTAVIAPLFTADTDVIDFGVVSIGGRALLRVTLSSNVDYELTIQIEPMNATGPFAVINAIRKLSARGKIVLVCECRPTASSHLSAAICCSTQGPGLDIPIKCRSVNPTIEIKGVQSISSPSDGLLDFKNVVVSDSVTKKVSIVNKSAFPVEISIKRSCLASLPIAQHASFIQRNSEGKQLFSFSPENAYIQPGEAVEFECMFSPGNAQFEPFKENVSIYAGSTYLVMSLCLCGKVWDRQLIVTASEAHEESFVSNYGSASNGWMSLYSDVYNSPEASAVLAASRFELLGLEIKKGAALCLEFQDPFGPLFDSAGVDSAKAKAQKPGVKQQVKRLCILSVKMQSSRHGSTSNGTFEIIPSRALKESGLWSFSVEKGAVPAGGNVNVDVTCTQPQPKGLGGLHLGSWQSYNLSLSLKGGWISEGKQDESRIEVVLKAFVKL